MRVLITFAVEAEFAPWRRLRKNWSTPDPALDAYETTIGPAKVFVVLTGVGSERPWSATAVACWGERPFDIVICSGLAGALRPEHKPGEVLVARTVRNFKPRQALACDDALVKLAAECGAKIVEAFYTSDQILVRAEDKQKLGLTADAVEMESCRVIRQGGSLGWGARCVAIRAISDGVYEDLPIDFNRTITPAGDVNPRRVITEIVRHPRALRSLVRFGLQSRRAAHSLAVFLDRYVATLGEVSVPSGNASLEEVAAT